MTGEKFTLMQYSISAILGLIEAEDFVIPEIQRPFVWKRSQVRDLIDSLYSGYPTGYIITWKNPDVQTKDGGKANGKKILIDGQQRITSLKFAEDLDAADEVCVYAKLPRTFQIPTPVGNYSPDWAIAFYEGKVKHIFFIAETKGTMESLELRPIEQAKISCAKKLFNEMSTSNVVYHDVDSYQSLLNIMNSL